MISVLLATYNGANWLPQFLDSLYAQTLPDWQLLVRDDGSTDATIDILSAAAARHKRIVLVENGAHHGDDAAENGRRLGACGNFGALMRYALAGPDRYFAFADQDDVWLPHKLAAQRALLAELEDAVGPRTPILVHSDLTVVDRQLRVLHPSHTALAGLWRDCPQDAMLRTLLAHNFVTGCTMLFNRALLAAAAPLPPSAVLHDWWTACCAAAVGTISYLREPTVLYRQHGTNVVGARRDWLRPDRWRSAWDRYGRGVAQGAALRQRLREFGCGDDHPACDVLDQYARLFERSCPRWRRFRGAYRLRIGRPGVIHRLLHAAQAALTTA